MVSKAKLYVRDFEIPVPYAKTLNYQDAPEQTEVKTYIVVLRLCGKLSSLKSKMCYICCKKKKKDYICSVFMVLGT